MLKNYLTIAIRNLLRNKVFSTISIGGLVLGITAFMLLGLYVRNELSYDRYHENADRIVELIQKNLITNSEITPPEGLAPLMKDRFPEVEEFVRTTRGGFLKLGDVTFYDDAVLLVDQSFFTVFTVDVLAGDLSSAVSEPGTAAITEGEARKIFGRVDVLREIFEVRSGSNSEPYRITVVLKDFPSNTIFNSKIFVYRPDAGSYGWANRQSTTYLLLTDKDAIPGLEEKFPAMIDETYGESYPNITAPRPFSTERVSLSLLPLTDIHLATLESGSPLSVSAILQPTQILSIYMLAALLILLISCANYLNMSIAGLLRRLGEVGVRKTVGAKKKQVVVQFLFESVLICILAIIVGVVLVSILLPGFNTLMGSELSLERWFNVVGILEFGLFALVLGMLSGGYPACLVSKQAPNLLLREKPLGNARGSSMRKGLIVFQFAASVTFILAALTISNQMLYIRSNRLNMDGDDVAVIRIPDLAMVENVQTFKNRMVAYPSVINATWGAIPGSPHGAGGIDLVDGTRLIYYVLIGDYEYAQTLGLELLQGRFLNASDLAAAEAISRDSQELRGADYQTRVQFREDHPSPTVVNESALRMLHIEDDPLGRRVSELNNALIVGVVKDFHVQPLQEEIYPVSIQTGGTGTILLVRYQPGQFEEGIAATEEVWKSMSDEPFEYRLLNEVMDDDYHNELTMLTLSTWFTFLAVLIASMGLAGLAIIAIQRRTKEIGIRKVVGASVTQVVTLLSREFLLLVLIANIIAWPIAWYAMRRWLENFAYRIELSWWLFALAGLLALLIALATVSWQTIRAATANPVEALRYE